MNNETVGLVSFPPFFKPIHTLLRGGHYRFSARMQNRFLKQFFKKRSVPSKAVSFQSPQVIEYQRRESYEEWMIRIISPEWVSGFNLFDFFSRSLKAVKDQDGTLHDSDQVAWRRLASFSWDKDNETVVVSEEEEDDQEPIDGTRDLSHLVDVINCFYACNHETFTQDIIKELCNDPKHSSRPKNEWL